MRPNLSFNRTANSRLRRLKESLFGPLIVGVIIGAFVAVFGYGFTMEYGPNIHPSWQPLWLFAIGEGVLSFAGTTAVIVLVFGCGPLALGLLRHRGSNAPRA